jgi:hypothetical protein
MVPLRIGEFELILEVNAARAIPVHRAGEVVAVEGVGVEG